MTIERMARLYSYLTGIHVGDYELLRTGERIWNLKRCFNVREGMGKKDDKLPKRLIEPITTGPNKGSKIEDFEAQLEEAYQEFGWDVETGYPTKEKLKELDLDFAISEIY